MSFLAKLGLSQKKRDTSPLIGERKRKEQKEKARKKQRYIRIAIFTAFIGIIVISLPQTSFRSVDNYTINEPWRGDDLAAPFHFAIKKSETELEAEREQIRRSTPPIFHMSQTAEINVQTRLDSLFRNMQPVLDSYVQWQRAKLDESIPAANDSVRHAQEKQFSNIQLSAPAWNYLLENYANNRIGNQPAARFVGNDIKSRIEFLISDVMLDGIINMSKADLTLEEITVRDLRQRTERNINTANTRDLAEVREFAQFRFSRNHAQENADVAYQIFNQVISSNWIYNASDTQSRLEELLGNISLTKGAVAQGEIIVRRGDLVTPAIANRLDSLAEARATTATEIERWLRFSGEMIVILITCLVFFMYLYLYRRRIYENSGMFLLVFLVLSMVILAAGIIDTLEGVSGYIVPVAIAPIILTIIYDSRVGLMATITLAIIMAIINENSFELLVATTTACSMGVFSVRDIKKRSQFFFTTPGVVFVTYMLVISGFALARFSGFEKFGNDMFYIAINAVFILFTYPLILFFEKSFKITTDFTLLELGDTNHPLLKELMTKAPGTFHHSLQVANLAEAAASAIGANSLMCRVGALYHDIGKTVKPGYFIENQSGVNDHDRLKARMSALVIKAHVSDGVKMAEEHSLPKVIVDFIKTHHGTSLIRYFYDKAQKNSEKDTEVPEDDYRYDGPVPFTREQGIMLLADGVEAASRAMKDPTYTKLENLINRMVEDHISEGQLNNCPLTFQQITIIKETFLGILVGVYHSRVEYPDDKKDSKKEKKKELRAEQDESTEKESAV